MMLGTRLAALRKAQGLTQEQLAEMLNVTRQAVSKWESGAAIPETEKLIRLSELYGCSLDSLVRGNETEPVPEKEAPAQKETSFLRNLFRDRKSKITVHGLPLWHFGLHARGVIAIGPEACGVLAFGFLARGIFPIGLLALGAFPFGVLSIGLAAYGAFAIGLLAAGAICAGLISAGAISLGILSFGAISAGDFAIGALAIGKYAAIGDHARGMIALGQSEAQGSLLSFIGELDALQKDAVLTALDENVPFLLRWASSVFRLFIQ